jgi:PEP-CTERM motif-containing protein
MIRPNRRSATLASLVLGCAALGAFQESQASPIAYQFQISSDVWTCGRLRPAGQACPTALNGTLTVDSAQSGFAAQFVDFTLEMGSFLFTRDQLSASGAASSSLTFDSGGLLTAFNFRNFLGPVVSGSFPIYYMNLSSGSTGEYRFGDRGDYIVENRCNGCVSFERAVPEPGALGLLAAGLGGLWITRRRRKSAIQ